MTGSEEDKLTRDIRQVLDDNPPDADTRHALQRIRGKALASDAKRSRRTPWLEFALASTLVAVLAVNLTGRSSNVKDRPSQAVTATTQPAPAKSTIKSSPVADTGALPDADLLENLELYEDADFYQWLSEQDSEGALDA
jgi:hypothetical protein